jgi:hypothetical protein
MPVTVYTAKGITATVDACMSVCMSVWCDKSGLYPHRLLESDEMLHGGGVHMGKKTTKIVEIWRALGAMDVSQRSKNVNICLSWH